MPDNTMQLSYNDSVKPSQIVNSALAIAHSIVHPNDHPYNFGYMCQQERDHFLDAVDQLFVALEGEQSEEWLLELANLIVEVLEDK